MVIKREVDGKTLEFELTGKELYEAYRVQEHRFDCDDIRDMLYTYDDEEDFVETFGFDWTEVEDNIDDIAYEMRRQMDKYGVDMDYAREEALREWKAL